MTHFARKKSELSKQEINTNNYSEPPKQEINTNNYIDSYEQNLYIEYGDHPYNNENRNPYKSSTEKNNNQKKKHLITFNSMIKIPTEYKLVSAEIINFLYNLNNLSIVQEMGKKTVIVDECGETDLDLYMLKAKGNISFISNIAVEPKIEYESKIGLLDYSMQNIILSITENIPIDTILKYSLTPLKYHSVDTHHVKIKHIELSPFSSSDPNLYKILGEFQFYYE
ncbi:hypothetical protein ABEY53_22020 [Bacillus mycoides]|uniref:hypothetical protein n=1 Tax=Bacillus mycoides TaxID=1405 RepID=UPI003D1DC644